ncbi:hypothetical protein [Brevundimonas goettingensis]|uniref:DUF4440 domain-containing protein n=1 Tax=Brevundimonas goettingensis TaxID=2774190 RepID=A0A975C347_9CAUL|nr:hypothetical protein [Brevundimonas goettingensis]QTC90456.1 hypothetical protein IFJ75_14385 [Brevundimonas goettingensis]
MNRILTATAAGLYVALLAHPVNAQSARELLDQEDARFCSHPEVWMRASVVVKGLLPTWKFSAAQRDAMDVAFSDQRFDFEHPDRIQVICSATVTLTSGGHAHSIRTRFDALPRDQAHDFRLEATNSSDLIDFLSALESP